MNVEVKEAGIDERLLKLLTSSPVSVTYAGDVRSLDNVSLARALGCDKVDFLVDSALDIFGVDMRYTDEVEWQREREREAKLNEPPQFVIDKVVLCFIGQKKYYKHRLP